jgi:hypothetical protein
MNSYLAASKSYQLVCDPLTKLALLQLKPISKVSLKNRGIPCILVGFSIHHADDIYRMLNLDTKRIIHSRDIFFLKEAYHDWIYCTVSQRKEIDDGNDDVIANSKIQEVKDGQDKLRSVEDQDELKKKKIYKAMRLLESSFDPEASTVLQNIE